MNETLKVISNRRSIRAYKDETLTKEQVEILVKAALESPTARNKQSWHFTVVTDKKLIAEINQETQKNLGFSSDVFYNAPLAIFISGDENNDYSAIDAGIAVENIAIAAESIGLGSVILGLPRGAFVGEKAGYFEEKLQFPPTHKFQIAIAVGVPNTTKEPHEILPGRVNFVGE
jgi:nitroreductase